MRKIHLLTLILAVGLFTSCEEMGFDDLIGSADLQVYYQDSLGNVDWTDSTSFRSCACDVYTDTNGTGILMLSADIDLAAEVTMDYPYLLVYVSDTTCQTYPLAPLTLENLSAWEYGVDLSLITDTNRLVYVMSDSSFIISTSGTFTVAGFTDYGSTLNGTMANITGYHITSSKLDYLHDKETAANNGDYAAAMYLANFQMTDLFTPVVITGHITGRRMNIEGILDDVSF